MKILKAGTRVKTVIGDIEAFVTGVSIEAEAVQYKIRYFSNGVVMEAWLFRFEIEPAKPKQQAGFGAKPVEEINNVIMLDSK